MSTIAATPAQTPRSFVIERRLVRLQIVAGTLFAIYVMAHLSNIILAPFGPEVFNSYQRLLRQIYQHPLIEIPFVLGPLLVHGIAGAWLLILRRNRAHRKNLWRRINTVAGLFLLLIIGGHVLATRGASFFYGVFPEFEGLSFSLYYMPAFFYPYYFLLGVAGFYHASNGLLTLARRAGNEEARRVQLTATIVMAMLVATALAAFGGLLFEIADPGTSEAAKLTARLLGE